MEGYFGGPLPRLEGDENSLCCPQRGFDQLRQAAVEVWNRGEEEEIEGAGIAADGSTVKATGRNRSPRRDGVSIAFSCEGRPCDEEGNADESTAGELVLFQHKGQTYIEWRQGTACPLPAGPAARSGAATTSASGAAFLTADAAEAGPARAAGTSASSCAVSVLPKRLCMRTRQCRSGRGHRDRLIRY